MVYLQKVKDTINLTSQSFAILANLHPINAFIHSNGSADMARDSFYKVQTVSMLTVTEPASTSGVT